MNYMTCNFIINITFYFQFKFTIKTFMDLGKYKSKDITNCKPKITISGEQEQLFIDALHKKRLTVNNPD